MSLGCARPNRLAGSKSPYLLQHACNPVDWRPWSAEVLEEAKALGKPLFISIGYSTCHWCHVMARESFEDPDVAAVLNEYYVPVKVDREEMPDVDSFYMAYCMAALGSCGWPLNVIATPDGKPFYVRTYVRREELIWILLQIAKVWYSGDRGLAEGAGDEALKALQNLWAPRPGDASLGDLISKAYRELLDSYDPVYGGFGRGPKFPTPHNIMFLLRYWARTGDGDAIEMALRTLDYIVAGGIHDIVGGGFHRYTVDSRWLQPHFEKMLYDQALILVALVESFQLTGDPTYRWASLKTIGFLLESMLGPEGGFYTALSAESGGVEGGFYTWSYDELRSALDEDEFKVAVRLFNVSEKGNYRDEATGRLTGRNILYVGLPLRDVARLHNMSLEGLLELIDRLAGKLKAVRDRREPPPVDDKVLTDWNGLILAALSKAYRALGNERVLQVAEGLASFLERRVVDGGKVYHCYKLGEAYVDGMLADYANLAWGLMELYETTFRDRWFELSLELANSIVKRFWDEARGILRFKEGGGITGDLVDVHDTSMPSSYSMALHVLTRASRYTGDPRFEDVALRAFKNVGGLVELNPSAFTYMLSTALDYWVDVSYEIVVASREGDREALDVIGEIWRRFMPNKVLIHVTEANRRVRELAPYTRNMVAVEGRPTVYICRNRTCDLPITGVEKLSKVLGAPLRYERR